MIKSRKLFLPPIKKNAHIGILGGSFDPPHLCHQLLALSFLALEPIDQLWVIPCADHAFKTTSTDFTHRLRMCELAFVRIQNVVVLDIESRLSSPSYTSETINYILDHAPTANLHFGIGSDLATSFAKWHNAEEIAKKARIIIFERTSYAVEKLPHVLRNARMHRGYALPDINSTDLREMLKSADRTTKMAYLDREIVAYIEEQGLYPF